MTASRLHFTLIELLVVIAIIAILASMLMPALNSALENGRSSKCSSNMKQLSYAISLYGDDFGFYVPYQTGDNKPWPQRLKEQNYVTTAKIYYCPSAIGELNHEKTGGRLSAFHNPDTTDKYVWEKITYGYNYFYAGANYANNSDANWIYQAARIGSFKYASRKIMMADARVKPGINYGTCLISPNLNAITDSNQIYDIHNNSANIMWVDGHISKEKNARTVYQMNVANTYYNRDMRPKN